LAKRLAAYVVVLFAATLINFVIPRLIPGDPIRVVIARLEMRGRQGFSEDLVLQYTHMFGLDKDLFTQFTNYMTQMLRGNLGLSISWFPSSVQEVIGRALPWTLYLMFTSVIISWVIGNVLGAIIGWQRDSKLARAILPAALVLGTIPYYMLAISLAFFFAYTIPLFPATGSSSIGIIWHGISLGYIADLIWHSVLPVLSIVISSVGWWMMSMKAMIANVLGEDYIMLARAKGMKTSVILRKYALRNALLPQVTGLAMTIGQTMSGALLTEVVFAYPGLGWLLYNAITNLDYPVIQGVVLLIIFTISTAVLLMDLLYPIIDPRIRYGEK